MIIGETNPFTPESTRNHAVEFDKKRDEFNRHVVITKIAGAALVTLGVVLTLAGAIIVWPLLTQELGGMLGGALPKDRATAEAVSHAIAKGVEGTAKTAYEVSKIGGDVGGAATGMFALVAGTILLGPFILLYAVPVLPGIFAIAGGMDLWTSTDKMQQ